MKKSILYCFIFGFGLSFAQTTNQQELAKAKAQDIYNFVNYIEWKNFEQLKEFRIGLLGADAELIKALNNLAAKKLVLQLPIKIIPFEEFSDVKNLPQTEILYVDIANFKHFSIDKVKKNVLVISYNEPDLYKSMITFMVIDNKLKFAFNNYLTQKAGLYIHEDFKNLATVYIQDLKEVSKNQQAKDQWATTFEKTNQQPLAKLKAQDIYNFVNYIEWKNFDQLKEFRIGLLGADQDLINALNNLAAKKLVMQLPMKIIPFDLNSDLKKLPITEILYVDAANFKNFDIEKIKKNTLVISYNEPDLYHSMISFMVIDTKLKFAFNSYLTKRAGLDIHEDFKTLAEVYIEDPNETKKNQLAKEQWGTAVEKIIGGIQKDGNQTVLSKTELLEVAKKFSEQEKNITEQKEKINTQISSIRSQEDSLKQQKERLGLSIKQNKIQEANIIEQKERINAQLNAILSQEQRAQLQEEKLNLTIAQNKLQEDELHLKMEELSIQQQRIVEQKEILVNQGKKIHDEELSIQVQEKRLVKQLEKINAQQAILWLALISGLAIIISLGLVYRNYKKTQRTNTLLENQKKEIQNQKNLVDAKHKEITDSINYAERIQESFLASEQLLNDNLGEHFVFFQPKDVVSGDFYWASVLNDGKFALATADSTGHGVPGAIMSLRNITSLEKAIENNTEPAEILNHTRKTIIERLKKDGSQEGGKDGMDCSLMCFNFKKNKLEYAAANNPVWIIRGKEILEFAPSKMPVGKHDRDSVPFVQTTIDLQKGDVIYAITDGLPDQFGGPKGKKFMHKKLKELLISISQLPMEVQKSQIKKSLDEWMTGYEQVDDITLIGVRV